jgi:hypothetical protein
MDTIKINTGAQDAVKMDADTLKIKADVPLMAGNYNKDLVFHIGDLKIRIGNEDPDHNHDEPGQSALVLDIANKLKEIQGRKMQDGAAVVEDEQERPDEDKQADEDASEQTEEQKADNEDTTETETPENGEQSNESGSDTVRTKKKGPAKRSGGKKQAPVTEQPVTEEEAPPIEQPQPVEDAGETPAQEEKPKSLEDVMKEGFDALKKEIAGVEERLGAKIDKVDANVSAAKAKIDLAAHRVISFVKAKFDKLDAKLDAKFDAMEKAIKEILEALSKMGAKFDAIEKEINALADTLKKMMENPKEKVDVIVLREPAKVEYPTCMINSQIAGDGSTNGSAAENAKNVSNIVGADIADIINKIVQKVYSPKSDVKPSK